MSGGGIIILCVIRRHFLCAAMDPTVSLSMHSLLPMVSFVDHVALSASKVVDDGEAPDNNEPEMGRHGSRVADGEVYEGELVLVRCGSAVGGEEQEVWRGGGMAWPMVE